MFNNRIFLLALTVLFSIGLAFASNGFAVTCKDLSKKQCESADTCSWIKSYTTKSGKTVAAYCRTKSGKKKASSSKPTKSSSTSKDTKKN